MVLWINKENWNETKIKGISFVCSRTITEDIDFYAVKLANCFYEKKNELLKIIVTEISDFYGRRGFSEQEIVEKLGVPQVTISSNEYGELVFLHNSMDEHIIICEFFGIFEIQSIYIDG